MALVRTTTSAAVKVGDTIIPVASTATGFPSVGLITNPQQPMWIDDELMFVVQVPAVNTVQVRSRGANGTAVQAHDVNASVVTSSAVGDFPAIGAGFLTERSPWTPDIVSYGQDGAIAVPIEDTTTAYLTKVTAGAYTLGAPSLAIDGFQLLLSSKTAAAHVVTAPALFQTGVAGGPFTTLTFPAQAGAAVTLVAASGLWSVVSGNGAVVFT